MAKVFVKDDDKIYSLQVKLASQLLLEERLRAARRTNSQNKIKEDTDEKLK